MSRRRRLSDEERALWNGLARTITPLRRSPRPAPPSAAAAPTGEPAARVVVTVAAPERSVPPLAPLERRLKQRVARGRAPIDDRLDLHGMTQAQAHAALLRFLRHAQDKDARLVLVVTGKGSGKAADPGEPDPSIERGVLRRRVPMWLALPEFRPFVVGFDDAGPGHGGHGALYVRLRRGRRESFR